MVGTERPWECLRFGTTAPEERRFTAQRRRPTDTIAPILEGCVRSPLGGQELVPWHASSSFLGRTQVSTRRSHRWDPRPVRLRHLPDEMYLYVGMSGPLEIDYLTDCCDCEISSNRVRRRDGRMYFIQQKAAAVYDDLHLFQK